MLGVHILDVLYNVVIEHLAQCFVLASEELEEQFKQGCGLDQTFVAQQDQRSAESLR